MPFSPTKHRPDSRTDVVDLVPAIPAVVAITEIKRAAIIQRLHEANGHRCDVIVSAADCQRCLSEMCRIIAYLLPRERHVAISLLIEVVVEGPGAISGDITT